MREAGAPAVVLVSEVFPPSLGGSGALLENVYKRLGGPPTTVITDSSTGVGLGARSGPFRFVHAKIGGRSWGVTSFSSLGRYLGLAACVRRECRGRATVVHCGRALPEGLSALLVRRVYGGPRYLCWTHGEELEYAARSRELALLLSCVHRGAAAIVANCHNTARRLQSIGVTAEKLHVVYPGVDAGRFSNGDRMRSIRSRFARDSEVLLLTVGRLQRRKGHDLALRAVASLRNRRPGLRYVIVGDGEERASLERFVVQEGLGDSVYFVGAVAEDELPAYYASADIFVHPNRVDAGDIEGFGLVFLEAAAAGLPSIGGASGGVPEAVEDGTTGVLVGGEDVGELASAIETLAASETMRRRMGDAGRARVLRLFTWDRAASEIAAIHQTLGETA